VAEEHRRKMIRSVREAHKAHRAAIEEYGGSHTGYYSHDLNLDEHDPIEIKFEKPAEPGDKARAREAGEKEPETVTAVIEQKPVISITANQAGWQLLQEMLGD
jgi:hypothetical protein